MKEELFIQSAFDVFKTTIEHQNYLFNGFISIVGTIIAIVLFVNWVMIYKNLKRTFIDMFNEKIQEIDKKYETKLSEFEKIYESKIDQIINKINITQGDILKSSSDDSFNNNDIPTALRQAFLSLTHYSNAKDDSNLRRMTDFILFILKNKNIDFKDISNNYESFIEISEKYIPNILLIERKFIKDELNKIKINSQNSTNPE